MFRVSLVLFIALLVNGCASSSSNVPVVSTVSKPTQSVDSRLVKYAFNEGCVMMKNGYMVCPKSMNR